MYLKALTARGFKSFADRVTLEFEPGISVIVGPNGSGKSNIADAVMWVLGEQSPRNLRGGRMEDVIFSGSATRQPMNMAEVSLVLDNTRGGLSVGFPEVVITRRIFRSGESEYLLNNAPCRLVDIQELLSDLGVGRELTAVVGQNRLEAIIRSSPEERRAFIEEAAGLRKHRRRKEKALRKLEGMERNMVRIKDIISEVNKQLRPLERQAQQAREYQSLVSEIRDLSIRILVAELEELRGQWEDRRLEEEKLLREAEEVEERVRAGKERQALLEGTLRDLRATLEGCHRREMRLLSLGERLRSCHRLGQERLKFFAALLGDFSYRERWASRREELEARLSALEEESAAAEIEMLRAEEEEEALLGEMSALAEQMERATGMERDLRRSVQQERERAKALAEGLNRERERQEKLRAEMESLEAEKRALREEKEDLEKRMGEKEEELARLGARRREIEDKTASLRQDLERFEEELESVSRRQRKSFQEEALVVARLQALQEVFSSRLDYASSAARVLEERGAAEGVLGMLLHLIRVPEEWEKALESYLGPWLFCVVTRNLEDSLEAVRLLKREEAGYGLFLPLSELESGSLEEKAELASRTGGVSAYQAVECDPEIKPALLYLLADVVLCRNLEEAAARAELYPGLTFVTSDGDVVAPRRLVKGGARPRSPFHIVARRREMEDLQEMLEWCDEEALSLEVRRKSVVGTISRLRKDLEALEEEGKRLEVAWRECQLEMKSLLEREEEARSRLEHLAEKAEKAKESLSRSISRAEEMRHEAEALRKTIQKMETYLREAEEDLESIRLRESELTGRLQEIKAERASLRERHYQLKRRVEEARREASEPAPPDREGVRLLVQAQQELLSLVERLLERHRALEERTEKREREVREELEDAEREHGELRALLESLESRQSELREIVHNRDLATAELKLRVDMLVKRLLEEYKVPLETAIAEYRPEAPLPEMRSRLEKLERRRDMLGQVNLRAVEEYQALKERHDFLQEQVEDLRESRASLLKVVRAIDREIIRIFKETFEEINLHFQEIFEKLFPQGRAELSLSDPTDLLNTGVEIEAQPKGKRLKKLTLLSGGETALTSLAFLFALFKTRPSPFYFLDEVEAALDDVNLHRFLNLLKEFREDSQLIVITHQKRTMEIADIIYGVSMQATGISRVVSQKLEEAEKLARAGSA